MLRYQTRSSRHRAFQHATLALGLILAGWTTARAQLVTINETFAGTTTSPSWTAYQGTGFYTPTLTAATGIDSSGSGWLRLTDLGGTEHSAEYLNTGFTSANATIAAKFNYAAYGGTGADGITFFLADANPKDANGNPTAFTPGAFGGSLGYANISAGTTVQSGMVGGYIGLGLDEYGNYATMNEGKHGGFGTSTALNAYPNAVSVRGPGSGQNGYDYLGGTAPFSPPFAFPSDSTRPTGSEARTFEVIITASNQLTVYMQAGAGAPMVALYSIDLSGYARPDQLIMGFTGSSGGSTDIHEVQGLSLASQVATLWTNGGGTSTWSSASNWNGSGGTIPATGADVLLDNHYVSSAQTIDVGTNRSIRSLQIDAPFSYTLNGGSLEFNDHGVLGPVGIIVSQGHGAAAHTVNSDVIADQDIEIKNQSSGALNIGGNVTTNGHNVTLDGSGTGGTAISGIISGTGGIVKNDGGTATLSGANTYSGGTVLNDGTLTAGNNNAFGTGTVTLNGGTLSSTGGKTISNTLTLQGNSGLSNITTSGTLTQTGANLTMNMAGATHSGIVNLSNDNTGRTLTVNVDSGTSAISGVIRDGGTSAGNLTKTGTGTLVLSGANTYTGTTSINVGTLQLGASDTLASNSALSIGGSGTLNLNGFSQQVGTLTAAGGSTINFGATSGANTFIFGNYVAPTSGVLVINNWESALDQLATTTALQNVSTIYISGQGVAQEAPNATPMGGSYANAHLLTPVTTTPIEWNGSSSTLWSTGTNWTGNSAPATTDVALFDNAGRLQPNVSVNRAFTIAGIKFGNSAGTNSAAYNIGGTRTLTLAGTVPYIQQQNNYQNQTISVSTLALANNTVVDITGSKNLTISSAITGTGINLIKDGTGAGKLILSGANTFSGGLFVNNGAIQLLSNTGLGNGTTTLSDGTTLELGGTITAANAISATGTGVGGGGAIRSVAGNGTLSGIITEGGASTFAADSGTTLNLTGQVTGTNQDTIVSGPGAINIARITTGTGNVTVGGNATVTFNGTTNANTYTGTTTVNSGTLILNKSAGTNAVAGNLVIGDGSSAATVRLAAANQIANTSDLTVNSNGKFDLNGQAEILAAFSGAGVIDNTNATATTLTFGDTTVTTFSGTIQDTGGNLSLVKQGTGKITLTGANNYAGTTSLNSGIIAIQNGTALGSGALTVASGGNLEVSGGLSAGITVANAMNLNGSGTAANDGAVQSTAGTNTLTGALTLQSATRIMADAGSTLNVNGNIGGAGLGLTLGGAGNISINGNIATGTGGTLTKDGSGYVILNPTANGSNFTGATAINDGTLEIQKSSALGTAAGGVTVASGGTLAISGGISTAESPVTLNGTGDNSTGAMRSISGANTVSGTVTLNSATTIGVESGTLTASGVVGGAAGSDLTKIGSGTLAFSGASANTIAGNITVADGTLFLNKTAGVNANGSGTLTIGDSTGAANSAVVQLGANTQLATGTAITLNSDAKLDVNGKTQTVASIADGGSGGASIALGTGGALTVAMAGNASFSGGISGAGTFTKSGAGTLTLTAAAGSSAIGPTTLAIAQGRVQLGAGNIVSNATTLNLNGGTLAIGGAFNETIGTLSLTLSSTIDFQNNTSALTFTNVNRTAGTLTISNWAGNPLGGGNSNLIFSNAATGFTGGTVLNEISFTGYGTGAIMLAGGEIVPNTGGTYYTWASTTGGNWNTTSNWSPTGSPGNIGDTAILGNAITGAATISLNGSNRTLGYLTIDSANNYTITGNNILFDVNAGGAQLINNNTGSSTIQSGLRLNDALTITQNGTGTLLVTGGITNNTGTNNVTVAGSGNLNISGNITTGTASLTKNGTGTLTLGGTNTYSGGTTINGGAVSISNDNNLGATTGSVAINGGTLQNTGVVTLNSSRALSVGASGGTFQTDGNLTYNGVIAGTGAITKTGAASLITGGASANTATGNVAINAGTLEIAKTAAVSAIGDNAAVTVASGATLKFNGTSGYTAETIGSLAGAGTVDNTSANGLALTVGGNNASTTFSGVIQDSGTGALALTKTGSGTLTLSGANSYSGTTTVSQGVLNIQNSTALGATTNGTSVATGAMLEVQNNIAVGTESLTLNGTGVGGNGALRNVSGNNSINGAITLGSATTVKSESGLLTLNGAVGGTQNLTLDGAGNITVNGAISTGTGTITKNGTGYTIFTGLNAFTGSTVVASGTLEIQNAASLGGTAGGTTVNSGATLALGGAGTTFAAEGLTLNGVGVGTGGALRNVSGDNTYSGAVSLASAATIGVDGSTTLTASGVISGAAANSLTKVGSGTLVLSGANTYSGPTSIIDGTVRIAADAKLGTAPAAATLGQLSLNGGTLNTTATMTLNTNRGVALGSAGGTLDTDSGTTLTYSGVVAGSSAGALTKAGAGTLVLAGANTYNGATNVNAGILRVAANGNLGATTSAINFNGGTLATTASMAMNRAITVNGGGGTLDVANNTTLTFGGSLSGSGNLNVNLNSNATLVFNSTIDFSAGSLTLSGGTLSLSGVTANLGTLHITGNTTLDFGNSTASVLNVGTFTVDAGVSVTVTNWMNVVDYFYATNFTGATPDTKGSTPENQITFTSPTSYPNSDTQWTSWDHEITPAPEPATYGAILLGACLGLVGFRRWRRRAAH